MHECKQNSDTRLWIYFWKCWRKSREIKIKGERNDSVVWIRCKSVYPLGKRKEANISKELLWVKAGKKLEDSEKGCIKIEEKCTELKVKETFYRERLDKTSIG